MADIRLHLSLQPRTVDTAADMASYVAKQLQLLC